MVADVWWDGVTGSTKQIIRIIEWENIVDQFGRTASATLGTIVDRPFLTFI